MPASPLSLGRGERAISPGRRAPQSAVVVTVAGGDRRRHGSPDPGPSSVKVRRLQETGTARDIVDGVARRSAIITDISGAATRLSYTRRPYCVAGVVTR